MTRVARKKYHYGDTHIRKKYKTKRRTKYMDEIHDDMIPGEAEKLLNQKIDLDKPGNGQHYCLHCARYFINLRSMTDHFRSKQHKRRLKALEDEKYTQKEADAAAGLGTYKPTTKRKVTTQETSDDVVMKKE